MSTYKKEISYKGFNIDLAIKKDNVSIWCERLGWGQAVFHLELDSDEETLRDINRAITRIKEDIDVKVKEASREVDRYNCVRDYLESL